MMVTSALLWIICIFAAILIATFIISLVFGNKWSKGRSLDPRRDQLEIVKRSTYFKRRIMNSEEYRLFQHLERWMNAKQRPHRLFAQVSLGEIIGSDDRSSYACINSKRCDFVIVDAMGYPILAIEYQGTGHFTPGAFERDYVKQKALKSAGVHLVEVFDGFRWRDVLTQLDSALGIPKKMSA